MSVAELAWGIALGLVLAKVILDVVDFLVEYPAQRKRNKMLRELMTDITKMTDKVIADIESKKAKKPKKVTKKGKK